ncbi:Uncharacterised protein [Mycobacteroides abscessus subsp. abscessus]|nr:Uncharacterised protein [Mycobacteroides abscessus subsp. abscessus]
MPPGSPIWSAGPHNLGRWTLLIPRPLAGRSVLDALSVPGCSGRGPMSPAWI